MLTATVFLPIIGAILIALLLRGKQAWLFATAIAVSDLVLSVLVFLRYKDLGDGFQMIERYSSWIPALEIEYFLAVDGLSAPLILLTGLLGVAAVFCSWSVNYRQKEYFAWLLVLQTAVMGVFAAQDFILFFIFWELELIPMYFLISIWGSGRREHSAMKFIIFTFAGSAFMLVGILALYLSNGVGTFDMTSLANMKLDDGIIPVQMIFFLFLIGFAVKLPVWPLHTWLPDAHTDAPTAVSVMLAGVLLKMGAYGLIRINVGMFPDVALDFALMFAILGVINIIYGAMVTLRQTDLKRLIAFSSISHMGYVLLGISSIGVAGAISPVGITGSAMQMFTHGTITGLLFVLVGLVYEKAHTRYIPDLGGLATKMPFVTVTFVVAGAASLGLPATSGFVSEMMIFLGAFPAYGLMTTLGVIGILITAGYILWTIQRTLFGHPLKVHDHITDANIIEAVAPALLVVSILLIGIYPAFLTDVFAPSINEIILRLD